MVKKSSTCNHQLKAKGTTRHSTRERSTTKKRIKGKHGKCGTGGKGIKPVTTTRRRRETSRRRLRRSGSGIGIGGKKSVNSKRTQPQLEIEKTLSCSSAPLHKTPKSYSEINACSPASRKTYTKDQTCYSYESLEKIAREWNRNYPYNKINTSTQHKNELWTNIKDKVDNCDTEWCWLDQPFIKRLQNDKDLRNSFKPPIPKGKWQWLSTDDIEFVCRQYEDVESKFKFLGAYPIDFSRIYHYIFGKFNINEYLKDGYSRIGIVFNEDPHDKAGSHWVGLFLDLKKRIAYFFDSYGEEPHKRIRDWVSKLVPTFKLVHNKTQHQFENSECGVYCIHFIVRMALGVPFSRIEKDIIRDCQINVKRPIYFNPFKYIDKIW
jgi:hypothetical protein